MNKCRGFATKKEGKGEIMREIQFRAWIKVTNKDWPVEFSSGQTMSEPFYLGSILSEIYGQPTTGNPGSPIILMQYTGLKDKNGREIYEGDILDMGRKHMDSIAQVVWADKMAAFIAASREPFMNLSNTKAMCDGGSEVIGNIYENPELLEK